MIDQEILAFINENHAATICCTVNDVPYCFNCLYSLLEKDGYLVFKSSLGTKHSDMLEINNKIAGSILPDEFDSAAIRGIQFEGIAMDDSEATVTGAANSYYSKYPIAMPMPGKLWVVDLKKIKFTDNTKGFGYKNNWSKQYSAVLTSV